MLFSRAVVDRPRSCHELIEHNQSRLRIRTKPFFRRTSGGARELKLSSFGAFPILFVASPHLASTEFD
jgi:hypothetical protein